MLYEGRRVEHVLLLVQKKSPLALDTLVEEDWQVFTGLCLVPQFYIESQNIV